MFEGEFKNGLVDGNVVIHYADGRRFKGAYHKGKRQGPCIEEDKNGKRFEGTYRNDVRDGRFVEKDRNDRLQPREPTKTANDLKTNLFRKLEKYKEIINNEIENLYILNNEKKNIL